MQIEFRKWQLLKKVLNQAMGNLNAVAEKIPD
jgi:hypothetical protein